MKELHIYFDMDGVLADFDRGVAELCHRNPLVQGKSTPAEDDALWDAVRKVPHFYGRLQPKEGAVEMFRSVYDRYGDRCQILTGIPRPKRGITDAGNDKILWAHRVLSPDVKVNIVYREEKPQYCSGPEDVLVDDYAKNIREWEALGGTGILSVSVEKTLEKIREMEERRNSL